MESPHQVGHFEVLERLGAGGMGEVYKARDTRLNRFVAIKFVAEAADQAARERFQREALAIAALNHPHICTLYEIGEDHGRPFLVLELLEGETLKARLARGALDPEQLLDWGSQIADALDAAHRKGVLHRDLKPENIWIAPGGHIKVLDFGLARLEGVTAPDAATVLTSPGVAMGTVPYMSPEQARGEALDPRSDVFSFGSVFYEMASGRPAFPAANAADSIAAVLTRQPKKLTEARPELPAKIDGVAERCLEKDPDLRFQSAADLRSELKRLRRESGSLSSTATPAARPARPWLRPAITAAVAVAVTVGLGVWAVRRYGGKPAAPPAAVHLQFRQLTYSGRVLDAVISPDGKFLAHVDIGPQGTSLHLMAVANGSDTQIVAPSPGCCYSPSFSPDGSTVTFVENRILYAVPVLGGNLQKLADPACSGAGYSPDGNQIAFVVPVGAGEIGLELARSDGSQPRLLRQAATGSGYVSQCWGTLGAPTHAPTWSPDGKTIALVRATQGQSEHVELVDAGDAHTLDLGPNLNGGGNDLAWLPDGRALVFTASMPAGAAPQAWELAVPTGQTVQLTSDLQGYASASVAASGALVLVHSDPQYSVWAQARPGGPLQEVPGGGPVQDGAGGLAWTPQGRILSVRSYGGKNQLWEETPGGDARRIGTVEFLATSVGGVGENGDILLGLVGLAEGTNSIYRLPADGSTMTELVHPAAGDQALFPVLLGGGNIGYLYLTGRNTQTLWEMPIAGGKARQIWDGFIFVDGNPASPDGTRIFAVSQGQNDAHLPVIVRTDGGSPQVTRLAMDFSTMRPPYGWTADGSAVTYLKQSGSVDNIWAFPVAGGAPRPLTHFTDLNIAAYAFARDGRLAVSRGTQNSDAVLATGLASGAESRIHGH